MEVSKVIKCAGLNILETSAVCLAAGTEDPGYPLYRLYDRDAGRLFRAAGAGTLEVRADQGATPRAVDRLIIPAGHNLDGATLEVLHSDDDSACQPAVPQWAQQGAGLINRTWTSVTKRYWKLRITAPSSAPELGELFLTSTYEWERNPERPAGPLESDFNVEHAQTAAGQDRFLVHGAPKRRRPYRVPRCSGAQRDNIEALFSEWAGAKPFWLEDHEGEWIYGRLQGPLNLREMAPGAYGFDFDFLEVLP
jgi:hypothetical protein